MSTIYKTCNKELIEDADKVTLTSLEDRLNKLIEESSRGYLDAPTFTGIYIKDDN